MWVIIINTSKTMCVCVCERERERERESANKFVYPVWFNIELVWGKEQLSVTL